MDVRGNCRFAGQEIVLGCDNVTDEVCSSSSVRWTFNANSIDEGRYDDGTDRSVRFKVLHFATKVDQIQLLLDLAFLRSHFTIFLGTVLSCVPCIFLPAKIATSDALQSLFLCIGDQWESGGTIVRGLSHLRRSFRRSRGSGRARLTGGGLRRKCHWSRTGLVPIRSGAKSGGRSRNFTRDVFRLQRFLHQFTAGIGFGSVACERNLDIDSQSLSELMFEESFGDIWANFIGNGAELQGEVGNRLGTTLYSCIKTFGEHQFFVGGDKKCVEFFLEIGKIGD